MVSTEQAAATRGEQRIHTHRQAAVVVGVLYILAAVVSVIGLELYGPILIGSNYLVNGAANKDQVLLGAAMELLVVCSVVGTAVGLFPVLRRVNERVALAYFCFRFMEATVIAVGIISVLSLLTLSQAYAAAAAPDAAAYAASGTLLKAAHDWTFLFGPALMLGINTTLYSSLLFKSRLVPRVIGVMGMGGAALVFLEGILVLFGVIAQVSVAGGLLALPVAVFEMTLAVWLIVKGFNRSALAALA